MAARKHVEGIEVRHEKRCRTEIGGRCNCSPSFRAHVWSKRDGKRIRRTFGNLAEAKSWRGDALRELRKGTLRAPTRVRLDQVADAWLAGARAGSIRTRSGDRYKPSAIRAYEQALELRVLPRLGGYRLSELRRTDVQDFVDGLLASRLNPSTLRNTLMPLRAICRRAVARGEIGINPTSGVELPAVRSKRERIASPGEADALLRALPEADRALWATATFAGLRLGELRALRWGDVDLAAGIIRVERSWDPKDGPIEPKSRAGRRRVPISRLLRGYLLDRKLDCAGSPSSLVFGSRNRPFVDTTMRNRALRAWEEAGLKPITLHELRHSFASLMIAAGVNAKALSQFMGHSSIQVTYDRYGHLMPGSESEAAGLLDSYFDQALKSAMEQARGAGQVSASDRSGAGSTGSRDARIGPTT